MHMDVHDCFLLNASLSLSLRVCVLVHVQVLLTGINVTALTAKVKRIGNSTATSSNDGMNCADVALPFAHCGDKNGATAPNPNAITSTDCSGSPSIDQDLVISSPPPHRRILLQSKWLVNDV